MFLGLSYIRLNHQFSVVNALHNISLDSIIPMNNLTRLAVKQYLTTVAVIIFIQRIHVKSQARISETFNRKLTKTYSKAATNLSEPHQLNRSVVLQKWI